MPRGQGHRLDQGTFEIAWAATVVIVQPQGTFCIEVSTQRALGRNPQTPAAPRGSARNPRVIAHS